MRSSKITVLGLILFGGINSCFVCGSLKAEEGLADFFPLADGNRWVYSES